LFAFILAQACGQNLYMSQEHADSHKIKLGEQINIHITITVIKAANALEAFKKDIHKKEAAII